MCHQAVDDAVRRVLACFNGDFAQLEDGGFQCHIAFLLVGHQFKCFRLVADGREDDFCDGLAGGDFIFSVNVGDDAVLPFVDDHVGEG